MAGLPDLNPYSNGTLGTAPAPPRSVPGFAGAANRVVTGSAPATSFGEGSVIGNGQNANRARMLGTQMGGASAYHQNFAPADESRSAQSDALGMARTAALGQAPSRAEILGKQMIGDSLHASLAGAASARGGPMNQAIATRNAQNGAAAFQQNGVNNIAALRAQEMAGARDAYAGQAAGMRAGDQNQTAMRTQNAQFQRGLNAQTQMGYEQMGNGLDVSQAQLDQGNGQFQQQLQEQGREYDGSLGEKHWESQTGVNQHATDRSTGLWSTIGGGLLSGAGGVAGGILAKSDPASKMNIRPMEMGGQAFAMPGTDALDRGEDLAAGRAAMGGAITKGFGALGGGISSHGASDLNDLYRSSRLVSDPMSKVGMSPMNAVDPGSGTVQLHDGGMSHSDLLAAGTGLAGPQPVPGMVGGGGITGGSVNTQGRGSDGTVNLVSDPRAKAEMFAMGMQHGAALEAGKRSRGAEMAGGELDRDAQYMAPGQADASPAPSWQGSPLDRDAERGAAHADRSAPPAEMMDAIGGGKAFQYKPGVAGEDPSKQHFGTTTADLKRTPMGASFVEPGSPLTDGFEAINTKEAVGPMLASLGNLNQRLRSIEMSGGKGRK